MKARPSSGFSINWKQSESKLSCLSQMLVQLQVVPGCAHIETILPDFFRPRPSVKDNLRMRHTMSHLSWLLLALLCPLGAWAEGPLGHSLKLQAASLMYIGSPVAAKVPHICLLAQPASKLDRPLDPGCSPQEPQPAWVHDLCFMSTWMQFLLLGTSTPLVHS